MDTNAIGKGTESGQTIRCGREEDMHPMLLIPLGFSHIKALLLLFEQEEGILLDGIRNDSRICKSKRFSEREAIIATDILQRIETVCSLPHITNVIESVGIGFCNT